VDASREKQKQNTGVLRFAQDDEIVSSGLEAGGEGEQSDVARLLDGERKLALMAGADAGQATRNDFAALGDESL
jgi:hypothetical protein